MKIALTTFLCFLSIAAFCDKKDDFPDFDREDFFKKQETAEWLCVYDQVAWISSDSVMKQDKSEVARIGTEWFCFQDKDKQWHAVYGKYTGDTYDQVFHFIASKGEMNRISDKVDTALTNSYSRALIAARQQMRAYKDSVNIDFNQYVRKNEDNTITVWLFPSTPSYKQIIYGWEFVYTYNPMGDVLLKDESYTGSLRYYGADTTKTIYLDYTDVKKATIGSVFYVTYYSKYFERIIINNEKSISSLMPVGNGVTWIHSMKD